MNIFITGAARGLGLYLCEQAVRRGHTVVAGIRGQGQQNEKWQSLLATYSQQIIPIQVDVLDEKAIQAAVALTATKVGSLDAIINNAAIVLARGQQLDELNFDDVEETFRVNVYGPMKVVKHFLPLLTRGDRQILMNVSSESGSSERLYAGDYPYSLSKATLNYFTLQLRKLLEGTTVETYAVHPGWIPTDMGGVEAPGDPLESATHMIDLIEGKVEKLAEGPAFIDFKGQPMQL